MRINKYIAQSGFCSRRKADEYVLEGKVKVNGEVVTMLGFEIRKKDKVTLDGKIIRADKLEYFKFYFLLFILELSIFPHITCFDKTHVLDLLINKYMII